MLATMKPRALPGRYFIASIPSKHATNKMLGVAIGAFKEPEGTTLYLKEAGLKLVQKIPGVKISKPHTRIMLSCLPDLEGYGFTGALCGILESKKTGVNIIAGYYHDHLFVYENKASIILPELKRAARAAKLELDQLV